MILYGADEDVCNWVSKQIFGYEGQFCPKLSKAIGIVKDNKLIAGMVYSNYITRPDGSPLNIELSGASIDKRWATRHNLRAFFSYPFHQLKLERVSAQCSAQNEGVIMFNQKLGWIEEGYHKDLWPLGGDSISWRMTRGECRWLV